MPPLHVAVVFGGPSVERDVSRVSARTIVHGLRAAGHTPTPVCVDSTGNFLPEVASRSILDSHAEIPRTGGTRGDLSPLLDCRPDVVFPIIHGTYGEDGTLQGLLDAFDLPFVGPGVLASALCMDKAACKIVLHEAGIPVTPGRVVRTADLAQRGESLLAELREALPLPMFVKPSNSGSSVGVVKVKSHAELATALETAFQYDDAVLVEEGINAREIECAVLGNDTPRASVVGEIIPGHEFYDYADKYIDTGSRAVIPADIMADTAERVRELAVRAFTATGCTGMARVDCFVDRSTNAVYVNELNTLPGFTSISMYPKLWEATGLPLPDLLTTLLELALERHTARSMRRAAFIPPPGLT